MIPHMPDITSAAQTRRVLGKGFQLFASTQAEPRARRPTDVAMAIVSALVVAICIGYAEVAGGFEADVIDLIDSLPGLFEPLWRITFWAPLVYSIVLLGIALLRGRHPLARDIFGSFVIALLTTAVIAAFVMDDDRSVSALLLDVNGPPVFPPGALVVATAAISTSSPHLSRPFRHFGRWLIASQLIAALFVQAAVPSGSVAALATARWLRRSSTSSTGRQAVGRPSHGSRRPSPSSACSSTTSRRPPCSGPGSCCSRGAIDEGPLLVKVYGRDAWDAQLLTSLWRMAWYRGGERAVGRSRVDLVEHEAFVTLLAERAGVRVPRLVTAGSAGSGDALVVVRPDGEPLAETLDESRRGQSTDCGRHRAAVARPAPAARGRHRPPPTRP